MADRQRIFVAYWVHVWEEQWFAPGVYYHHPASDGATPIRIERHYAVWVLLYSAVDAEAAYQMAIEGAANETDVNFDGPSHRNVYYTPGLHEMEEYPGANDFPRELATGAWVGAIDPADVDANGMPRIRSKDELEVFRVIPGSTPRASNG